MNNHLNYLVEENGIQICKVRSQSVGEYLTSHCTTFDPIKDDCLSCKEGYYLTTVPSGNLTLKRCKKNPVNCKIWFELVAPAVSYCGVCVDGFQVISIDGVNTCVSVDSLKQVAAKSPTFYPAYNNNCVLNDQCTDKYYGGINGKLERLFSCHVCK